VAQVRHVEIFPLHVTADTLHKPITEFVPVERLRHVLQERGSRGRPQRFGGTENLT
jgi:hypothetical protein